MIEVLFSDGTVRDYSWFPYRVGQIFLDGEGIDTKPLVILRIAKDDFHTRPTLVGTYSDEINGRK